MTWIGYHNWRNTPMKNMSFKADVYETEVRKYNSNAI